MVNNLIAEVIISGINRVGRKSPLVSEEKKNVRIQKDFSQNFNFAREKRSEQELKKCKRT